MDKMDKMDHREMISALADGQLRGEAFARGVQAAAADAPSRASWHAYHVVGEVLRSGQPALGTDPEAFLSRLQQRLAQEQPIAPRVAPVVAVTPPARAAQPAANDWLWKLAAGVASVAAVTAVGWNVWGTSGAAQPELAIATPAAVPGVTQASTTTMMRDPRLDQLLNAHRQFGGATVLQNSSGFLRNATFEAPPGR